jgi:RNA polymerase sigma-70 factor, ECF subfamily
MPAALPPGRPVATAAPVASPVDFHSQILAVLPSLRQQALALTRNRPDADDLVQTAVASAIAAKGSFEPGTNFRAWMSSILRNRFLSDCRRRRPTTPIDDAPSAFLARSGGQEESLAMKELRHHLGRLAPDHRLILIMISVQGLSYDEASEQLGIPAGTLKARVSRARAQLRVWMLGEEPARPTAQAQRTAQTMRAAPPLRRRSSAAVAESRVN